MTLRMFWLDITATAQWEGSKKKKKDRLHYIWKRSPSGDWLHYILKGHHPVLCGAGCSVWGIWELTCWLFFWCWFSLACHGKQLVSVTIVHPLDSDKMTSHSCKILSSSCLSTILRKLAGIFFHFHWWGRWCHGNCLWWPLYSNSLLLAHAPTSTVTSMHMGAISIACEHSAVANQVSWQLPFFANGERQYLLGTEHQFFSALERAKNFKWSWVM